MRQFVKLSLIILSALVFSVPVTYANEPRPVKNIILPKTETVDRDYFAAGDSVRLSGTVNGDAYLGGGTVYVDGTVNGDMFIAGGTVHISGPVKNDIRMIGGNITLDSPVGGNISVAGGNITFGKLAKVSGSILGAVGNMEIFSPVGKGITIAAGNVTVNSRIGGDMTVVTQQITFQPASVISGAVTYWSESDAVISETAKLTGQVVRFPLPKTDLQNELPVKESLRSARGIFAGLASFALIIGIIAMFTTGLILRGLAPSFTERTLKHMETDPVRAFGTGFLAVVIVPLVCVLTLVTLIGIPLAMVEIFLFGFLCMAGHIFAAFYVGKKVFSVFRIVPNDAWNLLTGLILLALLTLIPLIGWLTRAAIVCIGTGAVLTEKYAVFRQIRNRHII